MTVTVLDLAIFLALATACGSAASEFNIKEMVPLCQARVPTFHECIRSAVQILLPRMSQGIESWNLSPFDPNFVPIVSVGQATGPVTIHFDFINSTHTGLQEATVKKVTLEMVNPKLVRLVINTTVPSYVIYGKYKTHGRILLLPLEGTGVGNLTFGNVGIDYLVEAKPEKKPNDKFEYLHITTMKTWLRFTKNYIQLDNLFGGNKRLGTVMNKFLNENQKEILSYLQPHFDKAYLNIYRPILQKIFSHIPWADMFESGPPGQAPSN